MYQRKRIIIYSKYSFKFEKIDLLLVDTVIQYILKLTIFLLIWKVLIKNFYFNVYWYVLSSVKTWL